jgi:hypothetical protein
MERLLKSTSHCCKEPSKESMEREGEPPERKRARHSQRGVWMGSPRDVSRGPPRHGALPDLIDDEDRVVLESWGGRRPQKLHHLDGRGCQHEVMAQRVS